MINKTWIKVVLYLIQWLHLYPASGYRINASGVFGNTGSGGWYWSVDISSVYGLRFYLTSSSVQSSGTDPRAIGFSVRCVQYLPKYYLCFVKADFLIRITLSTVSVSVSK